MFSNSLLTLTYFIRRGTCVDFFRCTCIGSFRCMYNDVNFDLKMFSDYNSNYVIMVKKESCTFDCSVGLDAKISNFYHSTGHIWS